MPAVPGSLEEALAALEADHDFLLQGGCLHCGPDRDMDRLQAGSRGRCDASAARTPTSSSCTTTFEVRRLGRLTWFQVSGFRLWGAEGSKLQASSRSQCAERIAVGGKRPSDNRPPPNPLPPAGGGTRESRRACIASPAGGRGAPLPQAAERRGWDGWHQAPSIKPEPMR